MTTYLLRRSVQGVLVPDAATRLDFPVAMLFLMIVTLLTVVCNLLSNIVYAVVDPRIKYTQETGTFPPP